MSVYLSAFGRIVEIDTPINDEHSLVTLERKFCFHTKQKILSIRNDQLHGFDVNDVIRGRYNRDDSLSELTNLELISVNECPKCGCETEADRVKENVHCCDFFPEPTKQSMQLWEKNGDAHEIRLRFLNDDGEQFLSTWVNDGHYLFKKMSGLEPLKFYNITGLIEDGHVQTERDLVREINLLDINA